MSSKLTVSLLSTATRKREVAGIRAKFPNKVPVSARWGSRGVREGVFYVLTHSLRLAGYHREVRQGKVSASAGQNQVPGSAGAHHDAVPHHHQVPVPPSFTEHMLESFNTNSELNNTHASVLHRGEMFSW